MWILLRVDSLAEAERFVRDIAEYPHEPLLAPHYGDHVHCSVAGVFDHPTDDVVKAVA